MSIPTYEELMLPLLKNLENGQEQHVSSLADEMGDQLKLTEEEKDETLSSGQSTLKNRIGWARTYLKKAGLVKNPERGFVQITQIGSKVLSENPSKINNEYLMRFPGFQLFRQGNKSDEVAQEEIQLSFNNTPKELIDSSFKILNNQLAEEILDSIHNCSPGFFEGLVVDLMIGMGYGGSNKEAGKAIGKSSDGGIDGVINEDKLGLETIYLQAKRWKNKIGAPEIRDFVGSLVGKQSNKGVFITTSTFTSEAISYANSVQHKVILIDGLKLTDLMIEHGIGVSIVKQYSLKKIDNDYFSEEI
jgi:restriction system protein